ncbi:hypothetical protein PGB90_009279 [Kerria lacca]
MGADSEKKLNAFEMWCFRRMLKIPWTDFVSNNTVLARVKKENKTIVEDIKHRKLKYLTHKICENCIFMLAVQIRIQGKPIRGRRRFELMATNSPAYILCRTL